MAYLDYPGLSYFKNLLDETYLRASYTGDTTIAGDVTFTGDTVFSKDITGNVDGKAKKDWKGQQIDSTYIKGISTNNNAGQIVYTKGDGTSDYIMIDIMQGATASVTGKAGLVPAPTISERTKFLRGDGEWGVPTDIYVTQNLINTNDSFPILIGATAGATQSQVGTAIAFGTRVSVNPNTHTLIADHLILKHPTYRRSNSVSSKIMYTLNFADSDDGNGNNLSEIYGYIDPAVNGGEHELGFRLFGNPNVQGVEEIFTYLSVGLSKTNIPYGHAPSTPLPADHNEPTDIITRDWLARNGSETGLVHTTMNETIDGTKTFKKTVTINSGDNNNKASLYVQGNSDIHGNEHVYGTETVDGKLTANGTAEIKGGSSNTPSLTVTGSEYVSGNSNIHGNMDVDGNSNTDGNQTVGGTSTITGKLTANGTAEIKGGSGNNPSLLVTGNETVTGNSSITGNETVGGNISTTNGNISTTNGTVSGKTGSIGSGGLTVAGTTTSTGKITGNGGAEISGGSGLKINGNETVTGTTIVTGKVTANGGVEVSGGNGLVVNGNETVNGEIYKVVNNTPQEYVSYVTNKQETKTTIVNNLIKDKGGLAVDNNKNIYVSLKSGGGIKLNNNGQLYVDFSLDSGASAEAQAAANAMKEQILSTLGMQIPLTGNMTFYVNKDHASATNTWRSNQGVIDKTVGTQNKPFKSIGAAISCATEGYAIGAYHITIVITKSLDAGYNETISLPQFTHTTGYILLKSADTSSPSNYAVITNKETSDHAERINSGLCYCSGSGWHIQQIGFDQICRDPNNGIDNFPCLINSNDAGSVDVYACTFKSEYIGDAPSNGRIYMRLFSTYNGSNISFNQVEGFQTTINVTKGNSTNCTVFFAERQGQIFFNPANAGEATDTWHFINLTGTSSEVFAAALHSNILCNGGARYWMGFSGNIAGKKCSVYTGSSVTIQNVGENIGDVAGTCDTARFCFVSPASLLE